MKGMFDMMKKAQEMQKNMQKAQDELKEAEVTGRAAGEMVQVTMSGDFQVKAVSINKDAVDADDVETLEDVVTVAVNDAITQVKALTEEKMSAVTGGMKLPGM